VKRLLPGFLTAAVLSATFLVQARTIHLQGQRIDYLEDRATRLESAPRVVPRGSFNLHDFQPVPHEINLIDWNDDRAGECITNEWGK
jgi:hypothetical protein